MAAAGGPGQRDPNIAKNLLLDGHRQVLDEFIESFPTYRNFLLEIKAGGIGLVPAESLLGVEILWHKLSLFVF